jgi:hypothetical protein
MLFSVNDTLGYQIGAVDGDLGHVGRADWTVIRANGESR